MQKDKKHSLDISVRSFVTAPIMLLVPMVATYALTLLIPGGSYQRQMEAGQQVVVPGTYRQTAGGLPFWKWLLSPFLVLGAEDGGTIVAIIAFLLVVGGTFHILGRGGIMSHMLKKIVWRYREPVVHIAVLCHPVFYGAGGTGGQL